MNRCISNVIKFFFLSILCTWSITALSANSHGTLVEDSTDINNSDNEESSLSPDYLPAKEGKTIYVNISGISSRSGHAKKMTKLHKEHAESGWSVIGVVPLIENGDLEGFYVTYVRETY